jgi:hypothetical protein
MTIFDQQVGGIADVHADAANRLALMWELTNETNMHAMDGYKPLRQSTHKNGFENWVVFYTTTMQIDVINYI